jgi:E3 ubiquitin-protein ligase UBR1
MSESNQSNPTFPTYSNSFPASTLPAFFQTLAITSSYNLKGSGLAQIKARLYAFALQQGSPHSNLFYHVNSLDSVRRQLTLDPVKWSIASTASSDAAVTGEAGVIGNAGGGGEYSKSRRGKVCGHVFRAGESVYRCRDCSLDATCVLCAACYRASTHSSGNHDVTMNIHSGVGAGCCDCGDVEAFLEGGLGDCQFHSMPPGEEEDSTLSPAVEGLKVEVEELFKVLVDWMIRVLESSPEAMVTPTTIDDITASSATPTERMQQPPPTSAEFASPTVPNPFNYTSQPLYASSNARGKARDATDNSTTNGESDVDSTIPYSVVLWNDEKHSFIQVIDQVSRATRCSKAEASSVAQRVDTHGRDIIYISRDPAQLLRVARLIAAIDLAVTVRPALDTFYEQIAAEIVVFLKDLCATKVEGEGGILTEVLAKVLLQRGGARGMSRFQRLVGVDARLWKEPRKGLAELYVTLLGVSSQVKTDLSAYISGSYCSLKFHD